ncbi:hypothetical protein FPOAC2_05289 [Fusarium poae]|jgi:2-polyprenyl-3-methyl-5-hydroxy-6-metoxy-1,4-benzoquinol methylase|uniref:Methyltransferase domain-containing protein n=1 Tax=Fusarium poae TaxID=36050 RepID=A0A1B8AUC6_FUSPO|nr:hypothetical protein FPOAC1_005186 [Fusarium poae]KAG8671928.1 hypothetical protein FPOAC1_005186 [Fusarium poae]OBS24148.1 hypothetical protein FPOA_04695 [Fusarium poae]
MSHLERSLKSTSLAETRSTYNEWANNYNQDVEKEDYVAPKVAAANLVSHLHSRDISEVKILDAGCGTGLVGEALLNQGAKHIDGIDLSPGMLEVAERTGVYKSLSVANLAERLDIVADSYDAVICVGTMTEGHVGPEAFDEFLRAAKPGGIIVSTIRESVWQPKGYETKVDNLVEDRKVQLVSNVKEHQRIGAGVYAYFVILRVI